MKDQDYIAIYAILIGALASLAPTKYFKWITLFALISCILLGHIFYPDRYSDSMWLIGAVIALTIQYAALIFGMLAGWILRSLLMRRQR
jgi:hypothetical protein